MGLINAIGELLKAILGGALQLLIEIVDAIGKKSHDYRAGFGDRKKVISYAKHSSLYIGDDAIDPHITLTSALLIGRTGSGKSTKVYHTSLLQTPAPKVNENDAASMSYIVLDPASELERDTAAWNAHQGYCTEVINFSDASRSSVSWNPISGLTDSGVTRFAAEYIETALRNSNS